MAEGGGRSIGDLPEEIVSLVLSSTSPRDACRSAAVSSGFRAAACSDAVWERFLPPDYGDIVAASSASFLSKKELYLRFCDSISIDGGRRIFSLERATGRKCITLSARDLGITWGGTPQYWSWISIPGSRFAESAELVNVCWLEIRGRIAGRLLSPKTTYVAYFVFRLSEHSYGLDSRNQVVSIKAGTLVSSSEICLNPQAQERRSIHSDRFGFRRMLFRRPAPQAAAPPPAAAPPAAESPQIPRTRSDGWMEVPMGEFFDDDDVEEVEVSLHEIRGGHWKRGLIFHGIEMRPK